jgi:hypothetical protein
VTCFAGVDVGLDGAISVIVDGSPAPAMWEMPTREYASAGKKKRFIDSSKIRAIFSKLREQFPDLYVMIERPQLRPAMVASGHRCSVCGKDHLFAGQGLASQAAFLGQYERIAGILEGLGIAFEDVHPATWKADVFHGRSEKIDARILAGQLYPAIANKLTLKKSDGLAEALLLADYGKRRRTAPF